MSWIANDVSEYRDPASMTSLESRKGLDMSSGPVRRHRLLSVPCRHAGVPVRTLSVTEGQTLLVQCD